MKIHNCFISNSSSASYIIVTNNITVEQLKQIINHIETAKEIIKRDKIDLERDENGQPYAVDDYELFSFVNENNKWDVKFIDKNKILVDTYMNNFNMMNFLLYIKVPIEDIKIEHDGDIF